MTTSKLHQELLEEKRELELKLKFVRSAEFVIEKFLVEPSSYDYNSPYTSISVFPKKDKLSTLGMLFASSADADSAVKWMVEVDRKDPDSHPVKAMKEMRKHLRIVEKGWKEMWPTFVDVMKDMENTVNA